MTSIVVFGPLADRKRERERERERETSEVVGREGKAGDAPNQVLTS
jgi:hypothetical protein